MELLAANDGFYYDEMYERFDPQTSNNEIPILHVAYQEEYFTTDSHDSLLEYFEEWGLDSASFSKLICNPEVEVWSTYVPDSEAEDEAFFELIINKNIESSVNHDEELDLYEQISTYEHILSNEVREILGRPIIYSCVGEEQDSLCKHSTRSFQPAAQPSVSKSSATSHFPLFNNVEDIMEMLNAMPSLKQKNVKSSPGTNCNLTPKTTLQVEMPGKALTGCTTHLIDSSNGILPSGSGIIQPNVRLRSQKKKYLLYNSNPMYLLYDCSKREIPMLLLISHRMPGGFNAGRDGRTLFDPGGC